MTHTRTRKSSDERKSEIVTAALEMAGDIGPDRLTTQALAKQVGLSHSGIFRHFPTKESIWEAVGQHIGQMMRPKASAKDNSSRNPAQELIRFVHRHLSFFQATPAIPAILFSRELHSENEHLRKFFASMVASRHKHIAKIIKAGIDSNYFRNDIDADDAAYLILALIQGLAMRWSLNARNFDLADEGTRLLKLQLDGFTSPDTDNNQ